MKIKTKLILGFLFISLLAMLVGLFGLFRLKELARPLNKDIPLSIEHLYHRIEIDELASRIRYLHEVLSQSARNHVFTQDKLWEQKYYAFKPELDYIVQSAIDKSNNENKLFFKRIKAAKIMLVRMERTALEYNNEQKRLEAIKLLESGTYWKQKLLLQSELQNYFLKHGIGEKLEITVKLAAQHTQNILRQSIKITIFFIFAVIALSVTSGLFITRSITKPLQQLIQYTEKISSGDLTRQIDVVSKDEIGKLALSFNKMTINLKTYRDKLVLSKEYLDNIFRNMTETLIVINQNGTIMTINNATMELLGYKDDELVEKPINMIIAEEEVFTRSLIEDLIRKGFIINVETTYLSKDGRKISVLFSGKSMSDRQGNVQYIVCVASDITEHKRLEKEWLQMEIKMMANSKLALLGEIATGIAHEINQPLTYINSFIQRLERKLEDDTIDKDKLRGGLKTSRSQVSRITKIIQHLRTFGKADDMMKQPSSIETILDNTLLLMGEKIRQQDIELTKNIEPGLPEIAVNQNQMEQVFINLFMNSMDAFSDKTKNAEIQVDINRSENNEAVIIRFTDNGMGIKEENLPKLFEPFFTTKEVGKGTGLGLSIVYGIVQEHNGTITCESEVNRGTTFSIMLPVSA